MVFILWLYAALVLGLLISELKEWQRAQRILKPAAALGFLLIALYSGAPDSFYSQLILLGLLACAIGDICLLSRNSEKLFLAGMAAFALGHLAYLTAFTPLSRGGPIAVDLTVAALVIFSAIAVYIWLKPHLPKEMRLPVRLYFLIILIMVLNALRLPAHGPLFLAMIGAVMFAVSDVFVGRDRFVMRDPKNALSITPLYFGAQALIALSLQAGV